ncbi:MAG: glycerol-3-phosphate 1-O-acyltransferase PlsY [Thermotogae bacterium]|nr:glycerol-3-phosphate 1-O-acyltransferase PlsY [Thermotogota bacterium]
MKILLMFVFSYLIGSIPFSYLIPKYVKKVDITKVGSGNIGGTNVMRSIGFFYGAICMILDALKGFIPIMIAKNIFENNLVLFFVLLLPVIGHDYPIFMRFKGGKGVATTVGVMFGGTGYPGFIFLGMWIPIVLLTKIASLSSLIALFSSSVLNILLSKGDIYGYAYLVLSFLSLYKHRENLKRIIRGEEKRLDIAKMLRGKH